MSDPLSIQSSNKDVPAVFGENTQGGDGLFGHGAGAGRGVVGVSDTHTGVEGNSASGDGLFGTGQSGRGVVGVAQSGSGVEGNSTSGAGVFGSSQTGAGVFGRGSPAGHFEGDVVVTGDVQLAGGDVAEHFAVTDAFGVEAGSVMVLAGPDQVRVSSQPYDRRVAGVVSGAGGYRPGVVLDHHGEHNGSQPLALVGKAFCKVDASYGPVECGDLLTTSPTAGHAMIAADSGRAFGAILGKAMAPLAHGTGLVPVLIALT